jgi:hypothetical protein
MEYRILLALRLGTDIPLLTSSQPCHCVQRGRAAQQLLHPIKDTKGYHLFNQCKVNHPTAHARHHAVRDEIVRFLRKVGHSSRIENSDIVRLADPTSNLRTDITFNITSSEMCDIDVSITDHRQLVHGNKAAKHLLTPSMQASIVEKRKVDKYNSCLTKSGNLFKPYVIETNGRWGDVMRYEFSKLSSKLQFYIPDSDQQRNKTRWAAKITMAMFKSQGPFFLARIRSALGKYEQIANLEFRKLTDTPPTDHHKRAEYEDINPENDLTEDTSVQEL